jgi:hypothetical protein
MPPAQQEAVVDLDEPAFDNQNADVRAEERELAPLFCPSVTPSRRTPSMLAMSSWGHGQLVGRQAIEREQQPAAQLLVHRVMTITDRGLRHLRDQGCV